MKRFSKLVSSQVAENDFVGGDRDRDTDRGREEGTLLRSAVEADATTPPRDAPEDVRKAVWTEGLATLARLTGKPNGAARKILSILLKAANDDCAGVLSAIRECTGTADPISWLMAAAKARGSPRLSATDTIRDDWNPPTFADPALLGDGPRIGML